MLALWTDIMLARWTDIELLYLYQSLQDSFINPNLAPTIMIIQDTQSL